jgi:hypothetical protein
VLAINGHGNAGDVAGRAALLSQGSYACMYLIGALTVLIDCSSLYADILAYGARLHAVWYATREASASLKDLHPEGSGPWRFLPFCRVLTTDRFSRYRSLTTQDCPSIEMPLCDAEHGVYDNLPNCEGRGRKADTWFRGTPGCQNARYNCRNQICVTLLHGHCSGCY